MVVDKALLLSFDSDAVFQYSQLNRAAALAALPPHVLNLDRVGPWGFERPCELLDRVSVTSVKEGGAAEWAASFRLIDATL
jgi:hypothetical protein